MRLRVPSIAVRAANDADDEIEFLYRLTSYL